MTDLIKKGKRALTIGVAVTTIAWSIGVAALIPLSAQAATIASGDLIKASQPAVYYYGADGKRYVFPNEKTYFTWYADFGTVKTITDAELAAISIGGNVTYKPGVKMVKITTDPKVYAVSANGNLRWIQSEAIASALYGANWNTQVQDVSDAFFVNYTTGSNVTSSADFNPTTAAAAATSINVDKALTTVAAGQLSVALAATTPASMTAPANATAAAANLIMTKVNVTANSGDVTITGLKVTRSGLSQDAALSSVKLFDAGVQQGTSQSLNSAHQAIFSNLSIKVTGGTTKTLDLAATLASSATYNGNIVILGIAAASDITTSSSVSGTFPINGNPVTLTTGVTIGTALLYNGGSGTRNTTDLTVDSDAKDVRLTQVKIEAGSSEGVLVTQVTAVKNGTAAATDVKNIRLVNDTSGQTLATLTGLDSNGRAVFSNLSVSIAKGGNVELSVLADMANSGSGRTIAFDLHDGVAYTIMLTGTTYGFGITPTRSNFCAAAGTCTAQTINQGYLTVQKSASTPATGKVALGGSNVTLAAFDLTAGGESINVTSTVLTLNTGSAMPTSQITNVGIYNAAGQLVAGPKDGADTDDGDNEDLTFTDSYIVPVGTSTYYVKANISSSAGITANDTIEIDVKASGITAKGADSSKTTYTTSSGTTVPPGASAVAANVMTINGPALAVITVATPIAGSQVVNAQDAVMAYFDLDASSSGEDMKVTSVVVTDTLGGGAAVYTGLNNLELWGDADNTDATTTIVRLATSNSTATNANTVTFTFISPLKVKKGTISRLTLKADVVTSDTDGGGAADTHTFKIANTTDHVVSTGYSTGAALTESYSGSGQAQTVRAVGTLAIVAGADRPAALQLVAGSTGNYVMSYKLTSTYEPIDITTLYISTDSTRGSANVAKAKLYKDGVLIGSTTGYTLNAGGDATVTLDNGTLVVPKDSYTTVDIKIDLVDKTQLTSADTIEIGFGDDDGNATVWNAQDGTATAGSYLMTANGQSSGSTITATLIDSIGDGNGTVVASYIDPMYDGVLTVSLSATSPSGSQTAGVNKEVLKLNLTAAGDDITIDELELCVGGTATNVSGTGDVTIKSNDLGTTYATLTQAIFDGTWDDLGGNGSNAGTYYPMDPGISGGSCMSFGITGASGVTIADQASDSINDTTVAFTTSIVVAAGTTKTIRVFGDTTGAASTLTLQVNLQANGTAANKATTAGITWEDIENNTAVNSALTKNTPVSGGSLVY